jgi:hypothetical protein
VYFRLCTIKSSFQLIHESTLKQMKYGEIDEVCDVSILFVSVENYSVIAECHYSSGNSGMCGTSCLQVQNSIAILTAALPLCNSVASATFCMGGDHFCRNGSFSDVLHGRRPFLQKWKLQRRFAWAETIFAEMEASATFCMGGDHLRYKVPLYLFFFFY